MPRCAALLPTCVLRKERGGPDNISKKLGNMGTKIYSQFKFNCFVKGSEFNAIMSCTFSQTLSSHYCFQLCSLESTKTNFSEPISLPRANLKSLSC